MKLFFDTEFTGLSKDTTLISVGVVSEDKRKFYAEFTDYNHSKLTSWVKENVINHLLFRLPEPGESYYYSASRAEFNFPGSDFYSAWNLELNGTKKIIYESINHWLTQFDEVQFISDVCHYDFVLMVDLLTNGGTALDLPENISAVCHDLNMDIARHFHVSDREAFDMNREKIMNDLCGPEDIVTGNKHNSLYDAQIIKTIYDSLNKTN